MPENWWWGQKEAILHWYLVTTKAWERWRERETEADKSSVLSHIVVGLSCGERHRQYEAMHIGDRKEEAAFSCISYSHTASLRGVVINYATLALCNFLFGGPNLSHKLFAATLGWFKPIAHFSFNFLFCFLPLLLPLSWLLLAQVNTVTESTHFYFFAFQSLFSIFYFF